MIYPDASRCRLVTLPAGEPVSLAEAKAHLRIEHNDEDSLITALVTAARQRLEDHCRRAFLRQKWQALIDGRPCAGASVAIPRPALTAADPVVLEYLNSAESWTEHSGFRIVREDCPATLYFRDLPSDFLAWCSEPIWRVSYWTGYGSAPTDVPEPIRTSILRLAAHLYENRQLVTSVEPYLVPMTIDYLLTAYVVPWMGCM